MARNRILFVLWLLVWLAAWALGAGNLCGGILLASLLLAVGEMLLARRICRRLSASLTAGLSCRKGETLPVTLTVANAGLFTAPQVCAVVCCRDLLTGDRWEMPLRLAVGGRGEGRAAASLVPPRCGKLELTVTALTVYDLLGLRGVSRPVSLAAAALVLPEICPVDLTVSEHITPDADSAEYAMTRSGDDPSETMGLREYRSGDRLCSIHWKLSEKTDSLMVRRLGLPVDDTLLLALDNAADGALPDPAALEALGEAAVSVSAALCQAGVAHRIVWLDRRAAEPACRAVSSLEELTDALSDVLSAETAADGGDIVSCLPLRGADAARAVVLTLRPAGEETPELTYLTVSPSLLHGKEGLSLAL